MAQFVSLITKWHLYRNDVRLHITGGEPFLRKDFDRIIHLIGRNSSHFRWGILSNGSMLDRNNVQKMSAQGLHKFQVSLEGNEAINDKMRGQGSYVKTVRAIKLLVAAGVQTEVSLTLTKENKSTIPELIETLDNLGVTRLGIRRLVPYGKGQHLKNLLLTPYELRETYLQMNRLNNSLRSRSSNLHIDLGCDSGIFNDEKIGMYHNYCGVMKGIILVIMSNGDVVPCRRLPITLGNIGQDSLLSIYSRSPLLDKLMDRSKSHEICRECASFSECYGGAPCVTYCYDKHLHVPDVQCWRCNKDIGDVCNM
jgi:radical SAM protein with 4Fe4S-binding SPASM domain